MRAARGRPRSEAVDRAILAATRELLAARGYERMTVDAVAERAGAGKAAIYRRYADKADLAAAAVADLPGVLDAPHTGTARRDAAAVLREFRSALEGLLGMAFVGTMLVEEARNPALLDRFRERVIAPRRAIMRAALLRGVERGELRPDADLDLAASMMVGSYFAQHLGGMPMPADWAQRVVDLTWRGLAA